MTQLRRRSALVFFLSPVDPRFLSTLQNVLKTPERGGLTVNNLVYRYDVSKSDDGVGGEEGAFCTYLSHRLSMSMTS